MLGTEPEPDLRKNPISVGGGAVGIRALCWRRYGRWEAQGTRGGALAGLGGGGESGGGSGEGEGGGVSHCGLCSYGPCIALKT